MIVASVVYPKTSESRFDLNYYLRNHIPLVKSRWSALGLERVELLHGTAALGGGLPGFEMIALLTFASAQHLHDAVAQHGNEIIGDIPKFTDIQPVIQINESL